MYIDNHCQWPAMQPYRLPLEPGWSPQRTLFQHQPILEMVQFWKHLNGRRNVFPAFPLYLEASNVQTRQDWTSDYLLYRKRVSFRIISFDVQVPKVLTKVSSGVVTSIVRFITFFEVINDGNQVDFTFTSVKLSCVSIAEGGAYLIAACMPSYRSLFRKVRHNTTNGTRASRIYRLGSRDMISLNSRYINENRFSRLDNDGKTSNGKSDFVDSRTINSNLVHIDNIEVKHDVYVGISSDL